MAGDLTLARLNVLLGAEHTELDKALKDVADRVEKTGKKLTSIGSTLTRRVTAPLLAVGAAGFKVAGDFERSLGRMEGLVGIQRDQIDSWRGDIRRLAVEYGSSASEAADAMFFITSAGLRGSDALDTLEASLKASAAGLGDVTTIADLATSAMNAYGADTLGAADATDVLTAAVREGKLEPSQLAGAMGRVLPVASNMGIRFDEVGAAMAAMSRTGTRANIAADQLRQIMVALLKPTAEAETALADMGLSAKGLREQVREQGLLSALQTLSEEFEGNAEAQAKVFGDVGALAGVMDLMGASAETTASIFDALTEASGATDEAFGKQITSMFRLDQMWAAVKNAALELGNAIKGPVTAAIERITSGLQGLTSAIGEVPGPVLATGVALAGLAAAAGPVLFVVGKLMTFAPLLAKGLAGVATVASAMQAPLVALTAAKVAATAAAGALWTALAPALPLLAALGAAVAASVFIWKKWGDDITVAVRAAVNVIRDKLEPLVDFIRLVARGFVDVVQWWWENVTMRVARGVRDVATQLIDKLGPTIRKSAEMWASLLRVINPSLAFGLDSVVAFVDETRKEMIRLRGSVEGESAKAAAALDDFKASLADFSDEDLRMTIVGLGDNLTRAEQELDRLKQAQKEAADGTVEDMQRATDAVEEQEAAVRQLRASREAAVAAAQEARTAGSGGGGGGGGGGGEQAQEIAAVRAELETALAEADAMGAALKDAFDVDAAKAGALETAVKDLVAAEVDLNTVVGPQGETLRELANRYLDLRSGVQGALEDEQDLTRLRNEGEAVTNRLMTAEEKREARLEHLQEMLDANAISEEFHTRAVREAESAYRATTEEGERYAEMLAAQDRILADIQTPQEAYREKLALLNDMLNTVDEETGEMLLTQEQYNRAVAAAGEELERATGAASDAIDPMRELGDAIESSMTRGLQSAIQFTTKSESAFAQWGVQVSNEISRVLAKLAVLAALDFLATGGLGSTVASFVEPLTERATGGPVRAREPVLVGERGPEVFTPAGAGQITANHNLGAAASAPRFDFSDFPAARNPIAAARDDEWQMYLRESAQAMKEDGFDFGGRG